MEGRKRICLSNELLSLSFKGKEDKPSFDGVQQGHLTKEQIEWKILLQPSLGQSTFKQGSFCVFFRYANRMIITMIQ